MTLPESAAGPHSPDLRDYLEIIKIRKWVVAIVLALVVASAMAYSLSRTPIYISEAQVQVRPLPLTAVDAFNTGLNMETERSLASSPIVARLAADALGTDQEIDDLLGNLSVSVEPNTEILVFEYSDPSAQVAQRATQAFADAYLEGRQEQSNDDLDSLAEPLEERLANRTTRLAEVQENLAAATSDAVVNELQIKANSLVNSIAILREQLDDLLGKGTQNVGQVVKPADLPEGPASPQHVVNLAMALLLGAALGVTAALLMERLDDGLRGRADLELYSGVPVLAVVPSVRSWRRREQTLIVTLEEADSAAAEAYRTLRTGVLFDAASSGTKAIMLTSPQAAEGKTTTAANLGVSLAQAGKRVILVSADLRRPRLQEFFKDQTDRGLTNILAGEERLADVLVRPRGMTNLRMLTSGPIPGNPAELLGSNAMNALMLELRDEADFVLIDAAPVLAVADSLLLAQLADAVLLVADAETTHRSAVDQARMSLERVHARLIGAVLNNFDPAKASSYQSYTSYKSYRAQSEPTSGNGIRGLRRARRKA